MARANMNEMLRKRMSATQQASEQQTGDGQNTAAAAEISHRHRCFLTEIHCKICKNYSVHTVAELLRVLKNLYSPKSRII